MLKVCQVKTGQGRYALEAVATQSEDGLNIYLGGGEKPHIGTIVLCQPRPSLKMDGSLSQTTSVINLLGHKDDGVGVPMAQSLCLKMGVPVVITAGVHVSNANHHDIEMLRRAAEEITISLLELLLAEKSSEKE